MRTCLFMAVAGLLSASPTAHADSYTDFNLNAGLGNGSLSGLLVLDTTTAMFSSANLVATDFGQIYDLTKTSSFVDEGGRMGTFISSLSNSSIFFVLVLPADTLSGYVGSTICVNRTPGCPSSESGFTINGGNTYDGANSGTVTPAGAAVTPEPSSFALLGTGLVGLVGVLKRRFASSR